MKKKKKKKSKEIVGFCSFCGSQSNLKITYKIIIEFEMIIFSEVKISESLQCFWSSGELCVELNVWKKLFFFFFFFLLTECWIAINYNFEVSLSIFAIIIFIQKISISFIIYASQIQNFSFILKKEKKRRWGSILVKIFLV